MIISSCTVYSMDRHLAVLILNVDPIRINHNVKCLKTLPGHQQQTKLVIGRFFVQCYHSPSHAIEAAPDPNSKCRITPACLVSASSLVH